MKKLENHSRITQVVLAARSIGMSYGRYVSLTGGAVPPPDWLRMRVDPGALVCPDCGKRFYPTGRRQIYCSPACRKAAYDARSAAEKRRKRDSAAKLQKNN